MKTTKLTRSGGIFAGVAAGLAAHFGGNANYYRLAFLGLSWFHGLGLLVYVGLALFIKPDPAQLPPLDNVIRLWRMVSQVRSATKQSESTAEPTARSSKRKELHDVSEKDIKG